MASLQEIFSVYIKCVMLGIGIYMTFLQSKYLKTVDHLVRESKFTKVVGVGYLTIVFALLFLKF